MSIELRPCKPEELRLFLETAQTAFGGELKDEYVEAWSPFFDPARLLCAVEQDVIVGTAGAFRFSINVRAASCPRPASPRSG